MRLVLDGTRVRLDLDDPALRLTGPQQQALRTDREVVVTAGAGAGKTHTLATRYVALFLELAQRGRPEIDAVAVLTFTEKAAAEMAERCYTRLVALTAAARAQQAELDALEGPDKTPLGRHLAAALDHLCDRFDGARISTFHGFCARVLREFPVETGTALDTAVLDPVEAAGLATEALEDLLLEHLRADPDGVGALLDAFGSRARLVDAGRTAWLRRGELGPALRQHAGGPTPMEALVAAARWPVDEAATWLDRDGRPLLRQVLQIASLGGDSPFVRDTLRPVLQATDPGQCPTDPVDRALWVYGAVRTCLEALLTGTGTLRSLTHHTVLGKQADWPDQARYKQAKRALAILGERCERWPERAAVARELPTRADATLQRVLEPLARWVLAADDRFREALEARSAIDFTEMQHRAVRAVLEHAPVRDALVARHRYLVVDEFQDTDVRQWDLVRALGRPHGTPADRIFLVGDVKQAIYGFRGGDVTVFRTATGALGVDPVVLPHNFRSRPELIDWFNTVFPHVLAPAGAVLAPHEADYEPLQAGRTDAGGTVTVVLGDPDEAPTDADAAAHLIASEILPGVGVWGPLGLTDRERHPEPPIAILLRRRTKLADYEDALRARGVPYQVAQGVGFWSRPEVVDLVNALHGLATGAPASVVGALRSPLLALTDQQVTDLARSAETLLDFGRGSPPAFDPAVRQAWGRWGRLLQLARTAPPSTLLQALVGLARPAWHDTGGLDPGRAESNALRLVDQARDLEGSHGLHALADRFLAQVEAGTRESEAHLAPDRARVVILTIHAAKGLEFPVVLVPELDVPPRPEIGALSVGRPDGPGQWAMAFAVSDEEAAVQSRVRPGRLEAVKRAARDEADAEYRRLLYVAVTRARDHLVLLGNERPPGVRPSWADLVLPVLPGTTAVRSRTDVLAIPLPPPPTDDRTLPAPAPLTPVADRPVVELGASSLDGFTACPARWFRRHRLGLPEHTRRPDERARSLASVRGQVIHGLLEDEVEGPEVAAARWRAAVLDAGFSLGDADDGLERLLAHLDIAAASPHLERALAAPGHSELGFRIAHGPVALVGQIDRLWRDDEGWVVLDYKTEALTRPAADQVRARHRRQLLAYAWAADRILRQNDQPGVVRAEVLFTETGDCVALPFDSAAVVELESLLDEVGRVASGDWRTVERLAIEGPTDRPCDRCGFFRRGCAGRPTDPQPSLFSAPGP